MSKLFKEELQQYNSTLETLRSLLDPALQQKQWDQIREMAFSIIENDPSPFENIRNEKYTFKYIKECGIQAISDQLVDLALQGRKEIEFIKIIEQIELFWRDSKIQIEPYKN